MPESSTASKISLPLARDPAVPEPATAEPATAAPPTEPPATTPGSTQPLAADSVTTVSAFVDRVCIEVTKTEIDYKKELGGEPAYLTIEDVVPPPARPEDKDTVLHLLAYLIYTREGRKLLRDNRNDEDATGAPGKSRLALRSALTARLPTLAPDKIEVVIDSHFAADEYVKAFDAGNTDEKQRHEKIYKQKLLAILGALHDDAMGHDFSLAW